MNFLIIWFNDSVNKYIFFRRKSSRVIIRDAVEVRLRMLIPYIGQWPQVHSLKIILFSVLENCRLILLLQWSSSNMDTAPVMTSLTIEGLMALLNLTSVLLS